MSPLEKNKSSFFLSSGKDQDEKHATAPDKTFSHSLSRSPEPDPISRREFFRLMGASLGLAGMTACVRKPFQTIYPYARMPEHVLPGKSLYYATASHLGNDVAGLLVESHEGRPTKIEGNPTHASNRGATSHYHQARVLDLYDPDRLKTPVHRGQEKTLDEVRSDIGKIREKYKKNQGQGLAILTENIPSRVYHQTLKRFLNAFPRSRIHHYEPVNEDNILKGVKAATGQSLLPSYAKIEKADIVVSFDAEWIGRGPGHLQAMRAFGSRRDPDHPRGMNRLYVFEPHFTLTGAKADHRIRTRSSIIPLVLIHILGTLLKRDPGLATRVPNRIIREISKFSGMGSEAVEEKYVEAVISDLLSHKERSVIVSGPEQPPVVHGLVYVFNAILGNLGATVSYVPVASMTNGNSLGSLSHLVEEVNRGRIEDLFIVGGNPAYSAPADLGFSACLGKVRAVHLTERPNDTSDLSEWAVPRSHFLEQWGDLRSIDGTTSIVQPLIRRMYLSLSESEFIALLSGEEKPDYELTRASFKVTEDRFKKWLHEGIAYVGRNRGRLLAITDESLSSLISGVEEFADKGKFEAVFRPDFSLYDGRFINNGWLQECPDPITKLTWDNAAFLSTRTAAELGVKKGDLIAIQSSVGRAEAAVWVVPGHADNAITLSMGYGQKRAGAVGRGAGFDIAPLRSTSSFYLAYGIEVEKIGKTYSLASTQDHNSMTAPGKSETKDARPLYLETTKDIHDRGFEMLKKQGGFDRLVRFSDDQGREMGFGSRDMKSLWQELEYDEDRASHQWGMTIDLSKCTGCNACSVACTAENNIPIVGKDQVLNGREMHWIRLDRYFEGDPDTPRVATQPVTCHHCENAPCEQVCPVAATVHSREGLNDMVYNRCIGTRYCSNNCPYKVRRFNYFDFHQRHPHAVKKDRKHIFESIEEPAPTLARQFNPDVTVRMRGVMEKCTFCIQRINRAKIDAKVRDRKIEDGEIRTACEQACPAGAIQFGDLLDPNSRVIKNKKKMRNYEMLAELNVKPRLSYLAGIHNPHPFLAEDQKKAMDDE